MYKTQTAVKIIDINEIEFIRGTKFILSSVYYIIVYYFRWTIEI